MSILYNDSKINGGKVQVAQVVGWRVVENGDGLQLSHIHDKPSARQLVTLTSVAHFVIVKSLETEWICTFEFGSSTKINIFIN